MKLNKHNNKRIKISNINKDFEYNLVNNESNILKEDPSAYYKIHLYFEVLDTLINEMERRFSNENIKLAKSVSGIFDANSCDAHFFINKYADLLKLDATLATNEINI